MKKKKATLSEQFPNIIEQFVESTHNDDPVYIPSLVQTRQYKTVGYIFKRLPQWMNISYYTSLLNCS
jgi:hypothetical protein